MIVKTKLDQSRAESILRISQQLQSILVWAATSTSLLRHLFKNFGSKFC